jgi:hypothetical protein
MVDGMKAERRSVVVSKGALLGMPRLRWGEMVESGGCCFPDCSAQGGGLYTVFF